MGRYKSDKGPNIKKKGHPSSDAPITKEVDLDNLERADEMGEKYTEGPDEIANNVIHRHPNRNLNKPDIDKPAY